MSRTGTTTRDRGATRPAAPVRRPAEPAPRRPRSRRQRLLRLATIPLAIATVAWVLWESPLLAVRSVQVDGVHRLDAERVRAAAAVRTGTPLLQVDVGAVEARVRRLPQVAAVRAARGWPDRVVITVTERVPIAVVTQDGRRSLADADGVLFDTVTGEPPPGVVPVEVPHPVRGDPAFRAALSAVGALAGPVRGQVRQVTATNGQDVTLHLADGTTVVWGSGQDSARKATVLAALLDQLSSGALEPAKTIDVSAPNAVVLR